MGILIQNGTVVTAESQQKADVLIEGGTIRQVGPALDPTGHTVYDTSGPYGDARFTPDVRRGLPAPREAWIAERGDTVERSASPSLFHFPGARKPRRPIEWPRFDSLRGVPWRSHAATEITQGWLVMIVPPSAP